MAELISHIFGETRFFAKSRVGSEGVTGLKTRGRPPRLDDIGLMKEVTRKDMRLSGSPLVLWDYCMERRALIFQITAKKLFQLNGTNPHTLTFGSEADISHICQYGWYEWIYYRDVKTSFPYQKERLGRCLGPAKNEGNAMAQ
jgi:hypothetical protein